MLCKYCNADLKPEDKICPVCEKPVDETNNLINENVVNQVGNVSDGIEDIDQSLFAPLEPQNSNVQPEQEQLPENEILDLTQEQNNNYINDSIQMPSEVNVVNNIPVNPVSEIGNKEHKNPMKFIPIIIFIFLVILLAFTFYVSRSPKMIFNNLINKTYKELNSSIVTDVKNMKGNISLQTNILSSDDVSSEIFEILNNIYLGADYEIDYENKTTLVKLNTKYDNERLLDADVYLKNNKGYILLKDVYSKYLSTDVDDFDNMFEQVEVTEDHKVVLSEVKKAIIKSLKSDYFTKEKVDIKLNNETVAVTKNSLVLKEEVAEKIEKDVLISLKNNDKFITSLSTVTETTKDEILTSIEDELESLNSDADSSDTEITMSIYTKGLMNDLVKMDLVVASEGEKTTIEFTEETDNNYSIVLNGAGSTVNGSIKLLENTDETTKVEVSLTDSTSGTTIGLTIGMSIKYNAELTNVDISNSVDANTLTEEAADEIMTKLLENKGIQNLMGAFEGITYNDPSYDNMDEYGNEITCGDGVECYYDYELIY